MSDSNPRRPWADETGATPALPAREPSPFPGRSIVFASGKGGVGKTTLAANAAVAIADLGRGVALVDLDLGLANQDVLFRLPPGPTLRDVLRGTPISECARKAPSGVRVLPASSGHRDMASLARGDLRRLLSTLDGLDPKPDVTVADAAAGIGDSVVESILLADHAVIVTTPDPAAITDAYALIKVIVSAGRRESMSLVVNQADSLDEAYATASKISRAAESFLAIRPPEFGWIPRAKGVSRAGRAQRLFVHEEPDSPATRNLRFLVSRALDTRGDTT